MKTHIVIQSTDVCDTVVADVDLLQILQFFQAFNGSQAVGLNAENLEPLQLG